MSMRSQSIQSRKERSSEARGHAPERPRILFQQQPILLDDVPAAGAHAARHLINEDATPGAGVLPVHAQAFGREVDGGAG